MRTLNREQLAPLALLLAVAAIIPAFLLHAVGGRTVHVDSLVHFAGVGMTALVAAVAAFALTAAGIRAADARTVLVGAAFTAMAALLAIHGLATPGFIVARSGVAAFTGAATLPFGAGILALSTLPVLRRPRNVWPFVWLQVVGVAAVVTLGTLGLTYPTLIPKVPKPSGTAALTLLAFGSVFFALLLARTLKTYLLTRRRTDLAVVVGLAWLTLALPPALVTTYDQLAWWIGHFMEVLGILLVVCAIAFDLRRGRSSSRPLHGDLRAAELVAEEEGFLGLRIRALMVQLAAKDEYTEVHTRRVAQLAVEMGEELGLAPGRLRALAIGGLLHDMGKLRVPDSILGKPAALTEEEFAVIRKHTLWGEELLVELGGFNDGIHRLVRDHHERLDGKGYPGGLSGEEIDLETRIMTVCDVYDALISTRVYREAWPVERALALLHGDIGTAFDERCVLALEQVLRREGVFPALQATGGEARGDAKPKGRYGNGPLTAAA